MLFCFLLCIANICFFPIACCFTASIPSYLMLNTRSHTMHRTLLLSLAFAIQGLKFTSSSQESLKVQFLDLGFFFGGVDGDISCSAISFLLLSGCHLSATTLIYISFYYPLNEMMIFNFFSSSFKIHNSFNPFGLKNTANFSLCTFLFSSSSSKNHNSFHFPPADPYEAFFLHHQLYFVMTSLILPPNLRRVICALLLQPG